MKITFLIVVGLFASQAVARSDEAYGGVGIEFGMFKDPDGLEITTVYPHSTAEKAGLYHYQQIRSINGVDTNGKTHQECYQLLRGKPGSTVKLMVVDPLIGVTNMVAVVRETIAVLDESRDVVVKTNGHVNVNRVVFTGTEKSFTRLSNVHVQTNQVMWVATTNGGIAGIRFTGGQSVGSTKGAYSNSVSYCWNYRATPTSRLISGTNTASEVTVFTEVRPNRWEGTSHVSGAVTAGDAVRLYFHWEKDAGVRISYDAVDYIVRIADLPVKPPSSRSMAAAAAPSR